MKFAWVLAALIIPNAFAAQSCPVKGELIHWEINHCLAKFETDDYESYSTEVEKCREELNADKSVPKNECKRKEYLRRENCLRVVKYDKAVKLEACVKTDKFDPPIVKNGGIGG